MIKMAVQIGEHAGQPQSGIGMITMGYLDYYPVNARS
jgi:hypothetical protein